LTIAASAFIALAIEVRGEHVTLAAHVLFPVFETGRRALTAVGAGALIIARTVVTGAGRCRAVTSRTLGELGLGLDLGSISATQDPN